MLEARLRARRTRSSRAVTLDELHSGDVVMDGDRLQLTVRTSHDGYLYLAYCSSDPRTPKYHGLTVYPEQGAIRLIANKSTIAPGRAEDLVLDNRPGREALYLIISRRQLSSADTALADAIALARQRQDTSPAECGASFQRAIGGPRPEPRHREWTGGPEGGPGGGANRPTVDIERGGDVWHDGPRTGVAADRDGIVVLHYELDHVSAAAP